MYKVTIEKPNGEQDVLELEKLIITGRNDELPEGNVPIRVMGDFTVEEALTLCDNVRNKMLSKICELATIEGELDEFFRILGASIAGRYCEK